MPALDIPEAYWTIQPRPFTALVAGFAPPLAAVGIDVQRGAAAVVNGNDLELRQALASANGDAAAIAADVASEMNALATTPTSDVFTAYSGGDGLAARADIDAAVSAANEASFNFVMPDPPQASEPPIPSGQHEPEPPDPNAPPPPIIAQITALYEELLNREPDGGGLSHWLGEIAVNHHDLAWVREQIIASAEYQQLHGAAPPPPAVEPPPAPAPEPAPIDTSAFVTHDQLAAVIDGLDLSINLWV